MLKGCGYCGKSIDEGKEVQNKHLCHNDTELERKEKEYYSRQCAEYDRMEKES
ncbi:YdaE family protein [Salmonella enterica]|uniref:YdaE family protein n=1 Tax=Salmonella enterica TaxID=28901 RepID=UPI00398C6905